MLWLYTGNGEYDTMDDGNDDAFKNINNGEYDNDDNAFKILIIMVHQVHQHYHKY